MIDRSAQKSLEQYILMRIQDIQLEPEGRTRRIWGCQSERDFLYGYYVGRIEEGAMSYLLKATRAQAGPADGFEIRGIIEAHKRDLMAAIDQTIR